jgi:hypothetical protein
LGAQSLKKRGSRDKAALQGGVQTAGGGFVTDDSAMGTIRRF